VEQSGAPAQARLVLVTLILVAAVANLNLAVANVALPSIGAHFDSSQTTLDLIAVGYSLGLPERRPACSSSASGARGTRCTTSRSRGGRRSGSRRAPASSCSAR
jgi:hypothetical protein